MTCTRCGSTRLVWRSTIGARAETLCAGCRGPWRRFVLALFMGAAGRSHTAAKLSGTVCAEPCAACDAERRAVA